VVNSVSSLAFEMIIVGRMVDSYQRLAMNDGRKRPRLGFRHDACRAAPVRFRRRGVPFLFLQGDIDGGGLLEDEDRETTFEE